MVAMLAPKWIDSRYIVPVVAVLISTCTVGSAYYTRGGTQMYGKKCL